MLAGFADFIRTGGPFMYINIIVSVATLSVVVERVLRLFFQYSIDGKDFLEQILQHLKAGSAEKAIKTCNAVPNAVLPKIIKHGLSAMPRGKEAVSQALEESTLEWEPLIHKRVATLWSLANVATLIGLIGTIFGLISAFQAIGTAAPDKKTELLTKGIAEAMNNTAFGLTIAVTNIIGHMFVHSKSQHLIEDVEHSIVQIENFMENNPMAGEAEHVAAR